MLEPGDPAPAFTLPDQHGAEVPLSDLAGRRVVLYFDADGRVVEVLRKVKPARHDELVLGTLGASA